MALIFTFLIDMIPNETQQLPVDYTDEWMSQKNKPMQIPLNILNW